MPDRLATGGAETAASCATSTEEANAKAPVIQRTPRATPRRAMGLIEVDMELREYGSAGAMARSALARARRGRDSPQARGGGGSGALDTDCQRVAWAVWGAATAIVSGDTEIVVAATTAMVHAALAQPAGIVGQHGCWPCFCDGAVGAGIWCPACVIGIAARCIWSHARAGDAIVRWSVAAAIATRRRRRAMLIREQIRTPEMSLSLNCRQSGFCMEGVGICLKGELRTSFSPSSARQAGAH